MNIDMFTEYIQDALKHAKYEALEDDTYLATVEGSPRCNSRWRHHSSNAAKDLIEVLKAGEP